MYTFIVLTHKILIDKPGVVVGSRCTTDPVEFAPDGNILLPNLLKVDATSYWRGERSLQ